METVLHLHLWNVMCLGYQDDSSPFLMLYSGLLRVVESGSVSCMSAVSGVRWPGY